MDELDKLPSDENEPLVLADGSKLMPDGKVVGASIPQQQLIEVPSSREAIRIVTKTRRKLSDLPALPKAMNVINVVMLYSMYGLTDDEIAVATELSVEQIQRVREGEAYQLALKYARDSIVEGERATVREVLSAGAIRAAKRIDAMVDSQSEAAALAASREVLDRSGHSAQRGDLSDIMRNGGLTIEIVKKDKREGDIAVKLSMEQ